MRISWESISGGNRSHLHLRAGASVAGFIVDFYCHKAGLFLKVDGDVHDLQQEEDARRERVLSEMGLRVVRFGNEEVMRNTCSPLFWGDSGVDFDVVFGDGLVGM